MGDILSTYSIPNCSQIAVGGVTITPRRRGIYLGVVVLTMLDGFRRMHGDSSLYSGSMWVMEFLVLGLIAYEVVVGISHRRKERSRKKLVEARIGALRVALAAGQDILSMSPHGAGVTPGLQVWKETASKWVEDTRKLLESYSPQAATSFMHDSTRGQTMYYVGLVFMNDHHVLLTRLNNLKAIMEQPNVYF